jgi:hypothetical protein
MKEVILLGTSHSIQRGEKSPDQFQELIKHVYAESRFVCIAEEIENGNIYIAERFCNLNNLIYLCIEPDPQERIDLDIPSANQIAFQVIDEFDEKYPEIGMWPENPSEESLPSEVWKKYSKLTESSYRAREAEWLKRLVSFNLWPVLCICGANHFKHFSELLCANGIQVTPLSNDWEPSVNEQKRT